MNVKATRSSIIAIIILITLFTFSPAHPEELKVVTINVWSGLNYEGTAKMGEYETEDVRDKRYKILVNELKILKPDVIGINEANLLPRYARKLARDLNMDYIYAVGMGGIKFGNVGIPTNFREGDAILATKCLNLKSLGKKRLSGGGIISNVITFHTSESNQILGGVIDFAGKKVYIYNTHTHASPPNVPWYMERLENAYLEGKLTKEGFEIAKEKVIEDQKWRHDEIESLISWISENTPEGAPIVLLGDFNAEADTSEMKQVFDAGFIDTYDVANPDDPGHTWNPETNLNIRAYYESEVTSEMDPEKVADRLDDFVQKRIDFIFVSGGITPDNIINSEVVFDEAEGGRHPSDHYGVMSVVDIEEN
jgi:endonuclease/exonuclease/phosphatase family metal-dependent hydrolase